MVTEVTKKSCMLAWKPPADNGGYQITHYEVEKLDNTNGSWLPVKSVKSMSLEVMEFQVRGYKIRLIQQSIMDRQLLCQKVHQIISVMKTNTGVFVVFKTKRELKYQNELFL